jgi:tryptophanyl-tRNA synthetase
MGSGSKRHTVLSAVQPTNRLTLGNYLGAIRNWVGYQNDYDCFFFLVDLHAITSRQDPKELFENILYATAYYMAAGVDPKKAVIFPQSAVYQHAELAWILNCYSYMGELGRMTQYKDKSSRAGESIPVGLFSYPLLMAADILLYQSKYIPIGADQKQHLELTRDVAIRMNHLYGDLFVIPEPMIQSVGARILDLQDPSIKMSKSVSSDMGAVFMGDSFKDIEKKFKKAVTDSGSEISYDDDKPGVKNLIEIQSCMTGKSPEEIVQGYAGKMYGHLKLDTAHIVIETLRPIQDEAQRLINDRGHLLSVLADGAQRARARAEVTLKRVYDAVGFLPVRP